VHGRSLQLVASRAHVVGPAVSYSIGQGATMISAAWGVFVWHEFSAAPRKSRLFLVWMFPLLPLRADFDCSRSRILELETAAVFIKEAPCMCQRNRS